MVSSVAAQELNASDQLDGEDWDGTETETDSSLEGDNALDSGDNLENETADVDVRVTSKVAIDITPEDLNYPFVDLGEQETISNESHESVTIVNTGSEAIDRVWVNTSAPQDDPFGESDATQFDAGNFFQINISESAYDKYSALNANDAPSSYHYVNRVEYMFQDENEVPNFIVAPNGTGEVTTSTGTAPSEIEKGALRVGGEEYYYVLLEDPSGGCDGNGDSQLRLAETPFTSSQQGTIDFTDDGPDQQDPDYTNLSLRSIESNGIGVVDPANDDARVDLGSRDYALLASCDNAVADDRENILRTRYNPTASAFNDLNANNGGAQFIFSATDLSGSIQPSQFITLDTAVEVPRGVSQGSLDTGTFRVFVTSDNA